MTKLKEEFKQKWLTALRSGEYKQCTGHLELDGGYCCLGVALKVQYPDAHPELHHAFLYEDELPAMEDAIEWWTEEPELNAQIKNPVVMIEGIDEDGDKALVPRHLSELNDDENYTFAQIADLIEAQL